MSCSLHHFIYYKLALAEEGAWFDMKCPTAHRCTKYRPVNVQNVLRAVPLVDHQKALCYNKTKPERGARHFLFDAVPAAMNVILSDDLLLVHWRLNQVWLTCQICLHVGHTRIWFNALFPGMHSWWHFWSNLVQSRLQSTTTLKWFLMFPRFAPR